MSIIQLSPSEIRYSQDSIKSTFQDGTQLSTVIDNIIYGNKSLSSIPRIEVYQRNEKYYSSDNRRLYVFKEVQKRKWSHLKIEVSLKKGSFVPKLTTENDGESITFRN